jgi:hypothetical protein
MENVHLFLLRHVSTIDQMLLFNRLREEMRNLMPNATELQAGTGALRTVMSAQEANKLLPREIELESLIQQLCKNVDQDIKLGESLMEKIGPACKKYFADPKFPALKVKTDIPSTTITKQELL